MKFLSNIFVSFAIFCWLIKYLRWNRVSYVIPPSCKVVNQSNNLKDRWKSQLPTNSTVNCIFHWHISFSNSFVVLCQHLYLLMLLYSFSFLVCVVLNNWGVGLWQVLGAATMVSKTGKHPGVLKDDVTSPGGTTIAGVHELEKGSFRATLMNAVVAAANRSRELSQSWIIRECCPYCFTLLGRGESYVFWLYIVLISNKSQLPVLGGWIQTRVGSL